MSKPKPDPAICARLALARSDRGLSRADLAERVGVQRDAVNRWESAKAMPSSERLALCAHVLGVSEAWLRTGVAALPVTVPEHARRGR